MAVAVTEDSVLVEEVFELVNSRRLGVLVERMHAEQAARGRQKGDPTCVMRGTPRDPRDLMLAELEGRGKDPRKKNDPGLCTRDVNTLEEALTRWASRRGECGMECLTVGYVIQFSGEDLLALPNFGNGALSALKAALREVGLRLRGDRR